jgi:hypothetical protein
MYCLPTQHDFGRELEILKVLPKVLHQNIDVLASKVDERDLVYATCYSCSF